MILQLKSGCSKNKVEVPSSSQIMTEVTVSRQQVNLVNIQVSIATVSLTSLTLL